MISERNSKELKDQFIAAGSNGNKKKEIWEMIAEKIGVKGEGKYISQRYADLLSMYRRKREESKISGNSSEPVNWQYFETFQLNLGSDADGDPEVKVEIGRKDPVVKFPPEDHKEIKNSKKY